MNKFYYIPLFYSLVIFSFNSFNADLYATQLNSSSKGMEKSNLKYESTFLDELIAVESSGGSFEGKKTINEYVDDNIDDDIHSDEYENIVARALFKKLKKGDNRLVDGVLGILERIDEESNEKEDSNLHKVYCALISFLGVKQWDYSSLAQAKEEQFDKEGFPTDKEVKEVLKNAVHKIIQTKKK